MGVRERHVWSELWSTSLKCKRSLCGISGTCLKAPLSAFSLEISACSHNPPSSHQTPSHTTMNYPQTPNDPYDFSFWPDAAAFSEEERMAWAQVAGYAQPGLTIDDFSFDGLDAWGQSTTLPAAPQNTSDIDWIFGGTVPAGDMFGNGASFLDAIKTDTMAFAPPPAPSFPPYGMGALTQDVFFTQPNFSNSLPSTPSLTDVSSVPSPQGEGTGDGFMPFPTFEGAPSYFVQPPGPSLSQLDIAGVLLANQFTCAPPTRSTGDGNFAGQVPPDYRGTLDLMGMNGDMSYPGQFYNTEPNDYLAAPTEALAAMVINEKGVPSSSLGKRTRTSEENEPGPQKRARPNAIGVPGEAESTKRAPATRTRQKINSKSKAAGRGAERLAFTTAQGVYHRSLPGLSVSQGSMGALEQGQSSWIEERDVETWHDTGSLPQQQIVLQSAENAEVGGGLHKIPGNLSARDRLMLETTQADEERGAVREIKCKLCATKPPFKTWEIYKRHCKSCEKHPQASILKFCPKCGDYFGRPDSGVRHRKNKKYQKVCLETSQDEASEKQQKVERLLKEFEARLEHCLRNGEEIGPRFSDIVNKVLTNTSKKVSRR
ncbi:hypothetical protein EDB84DRAFT_1674228 [Lactarius hengduanensis]|nr:hypothetical protein EDB84DRAFT_1674228 [Lactarius hengduanensis]